MRLAAIFAFALLAPIASAAAQTGDDALLGMWGYRMAFPVGLSGTLTVQHDRRHWHAEISGATADADATPGDIRIVFPNEG